jgi:hypothetical protein
MSAPARTRQPISAALLCMGLAMGGVGLACGDSAGNDTTPTTTSTTVASSSTTATSAVPTTTAPTSTTIPTTAPTTAPPGPTAKPPTTTSAPLTSPVGTAQAAFNAWSARDVTTLERLTSATAAKVLNGREARDNVWVGPTCEGAAGSTYCTWTAERSKLVLRVGNEAASTGQAHAVTEASFS